MTAVNLGVFLAQIGKSVLLIDANLPDAGLHTWLGVERPHITVGDWIRGRLISMRDAVVSTRIAGLHLMGGSVDIGGGFDLSAEDRDHFMEELRKVEADYVLLDIPSGLHPLALDLFSRADISIAVSAATPDAVEATYRLIAASYLSVLRRHPGMGAISKEVLDELVLSAGRLPGTSAVIEALRNASSPMVEEARRLSTAFHPQLVINQIRVKSDQGLGDAMVAACSRWLGIAPRLLGTVEWDDNVWLSLRRGTPILIDFPQSRACRGLERVVRRLLSYNADEIAEPSPIAKPTELQNLYELLEIYPGASEEEVRRAFKQVKEYFGSDGLAVSGICTDSEREHYQHLAKQAHEILIDRSKRREYDRAVFPDGFPTAPPRIEDGEIVPGRVVTPHDTLPKVEIRDDQMVNGAFLAEIRKERNIELIDISNRARISIAYLKAIEEERFDDLPPPVYVRGFIIEYARYLKIDPDRAVSDFMAARDAHIKKKK
jgi:flagellar biosynthesis protein FlhG